MANVFWSEVVEAAGFGIAWLVLLLITIVWRDRTHPERHVLTFIWFLHSCAPMFIMLAAIALLLDNGCLKCSSNGNSEGEWARFVGYTLAFTALYITMAVYHMLEILPTLFGTVSILISWIAAIFTVLNDRSGASEKNAQIYWGIVGIAFLIIACAKIIIYSRLTKKLWDWLPVLSYPFFAILIWVFLWVGPDVSRRLGDTVTVIVYISLSALLIIAMAVTTVWGFGMRELAKRPPATQKPGITRRMR